MSGSPPHTGGIHVPERSVVRARVGALFLLLTACGPEQVTAPAAGPSFSGKHIGGGGGVSKIIGVDINTSSIPPVTIEGAPFSYDFTLTCDYKEGNEMFVEVSVEQGLFSGTVEHVVDSFHVDCGAGDGVVPRHAVCTISRSASASNSSPGVGTLTGGSAQLTVRLYQGYDTPTLVNFTWGGLTLVS